MLKTVSLSGKGAGRRIKTPVVRKMPHDQALPDPDEGEGKLISVQKGSDGLYPVPQDKTPTARFD